PDQIRQWVPGDYVTLGAEGFGFSDTREAARRYFNIDAESVVVAALAALARAGKVPASAPAEAARRYRIDEVVPAPEQDVEPRVVWPSAPTGGCLRTALRPGPEPLHASGPGRAAACHRTVPSTR